MSELELGAGKAARLAGRALWPSQTLAERRRRVPLAPAPAGGTPAELRAWRQAWGRYFGERVRILTDEWKAGER
jgi:hypothetical protein